MAKDLPDCLHARRPRLAPGLRGVFRAGRTAGRLLEINPASAPPGELAQGAAQPALADLFSEAGNSSGLAELRDEGESGTHLHVETGARYASSRSRRPVRDEEGQTAYIDGLLEDVAARAARKPGARR